MNLHQYFSLSKFANKWYYWYSYHFRKPKVPKVVQIEATNYCNFNCEMCYHKTMKRKKGFINVELYKDIVDEVAEAGTTGIRPQFAGEALLHPKIVDMVQYAKDKGMRVWFATTGSLLTPKLSAKIINTGIDKVGFSFHAGNREDFKKIHGVDFFDKCLKNIREFYEIRESLDKEKPKIGVGALISKNSYKNIHNITKLLGDYCDNIGFGNCTYQPLTMPKDCRIINYNLKRTYPCLELFGKMTILWNGDITTCCIDNEGWLKYGNAKDGVIKAFNSEAMQRYRKIHLKGQYHKMPLCENCAGPVVEFKYIPNEMKNKIINGDM